MLARLVLALQHFDQAELRFSLLLNRSGGVAPAAALFRAASWLGDGWIWYALILCLPWLYGWDGLYAAMHLAATGVVGVLIYRAIKQRTIRERPFVTHAVIRCAAAPLDRYSFPSGHTLHAVSFTWITASYFPEWSPALVAVASLIALSRVALGLHYPSDVAAGALLGAVLAMVGIRLVG